MNILVGKTFGIGNCIMSIPMIRALSTLGRVHVLVGTTPDDTGAKEIFGFLKEQGVVEKVHLDKVNDRIAFDVAIMAIPFDGRWHNGQHFLARRVIDGRRRPGNVERLGFDMWKKHEIEYMMENAEILGFSGSTPSTEFFPNPSDPDPVRIYLGFGYKRDNGGFGISKHFGNENFVTFVQSLINKRGEIIILGNEAPSNLGIVNEIKDGLKTIGCDVKDEMRISSLNESFFDASKCIAYFGNDSGFAHVMGSFGRKTFVMTPYEDLLLKNPVRGGVNRMEVFDRKTVDPEELANQFVDFVWGQRCV